MKKILLSMMILISGSMNGQEVLHTMHVINTKSGEEFTIEIMELGDDYFLKSSDTESYENKVISKYFFKETIQMFLEKEFITPEDYLALMEIHEGGEEPKRNNKDALMGGFSVETGDPNASGYYGVGGDGSGGNYRLGNRKALNKPKPEYDCNEEGRVVVSISVDQSGRVISADPGIKGTTNSAKCLLKTAKEAALKSRFNADSNAPSNQIGAIIYNFSLSE
ncbi:hypothetical protein LCM02_11595 [Lutimonas saemankumensis]|uniref:hypothetical protein n=1 Tax=Lutimonas saemankumensis TaxID=483016 RepID=UPI001CD1C04A|nr:hypothetical protein [Lutimonas saemankumensis]MCA0933099.1 hypothetical protein [Lutimonas saemankumensis]